MNWLKPYTEILKTCRHTKVSLNELQFLFSAVLLISWHSAFSGAYLPSHSCGGCCHLCPTLRPDISQPTCDILCTAPLCHYSSFTGGLLPRRTPPLAWCLAGHRSILSALSLTSSCSKEQTSLHLELHFLHLSCYNVHTFSSRCLCCASEFSVLMSVFFFFFNINVICCSAVLFFFPPFVQR